jgi:hypothetical protein
MQSYFDHCVVLALFTFNYKGLQGELRVGRTQSVSIGDSGTREDETQGPEVEPLATASQINKGLHTESVVHITNP